MKTSKLKTFLIAVFIFNLFPSFAWCMTGSLRPSQSEASFKCIDGRCLASAQKSSLMRMCEQMKSKAAWAQDWECQNAAYYTDDNNRLSVPELRRRLQKDPNSLSEEEKAILRAANRTGLIQFPNCKNPKNGATISGNAFLVRVNGQDAIVTSAHQLVDGNTGKIKNSCSPSDLTKAYFYPNISYLDLSHSSHPGMDSPKLERVEIDTKNNFNVDETINAKSSVNNKKDWVVFMLPEQISEQKSLDGSTRGYIPMQSGAIGDWESRKGYLIGYDPTFDKRNGGSASSYQRCDFDYSMENINHACDTSNGSSSSLLGIMQKGEIHFTGLHSRGEKDEDGKLVEVPLPDSIWRNTGLRADYIEQNNNIHFDR